MTGLMFVDLYISLGKTNKGLWPSKHRRKVHMAHLGSSPGEIFKSVDFFNSVASYSNKVNKISNMTL